MIVLPKPQQMYLSADETIKSEFYVQSEDEELIQALSPVLTKKGEVPVSFEKDAALPQEAYRLKAAEGKVMVSYAALQGAFRAAVTLKQIAMQAEDGEVPVFDIYDYPDIANRAYMLDISRGKVPSLESLKRLVDLLTDLKYNQLQLYIDNFSFAYKYFEEYCKDTEPLTREEILELDAYCKKHFIELVPNQNGFGHMTAWLEKEELSDLAIKREDGKPSSTLNPLDSRSLELVDRIYESCLDCYSSSLVNVCMDEPFELGMGQTKEACEKYGIHKVFSDYVNKVCALVKQKYHKNPMVWITDVTEMDEALQNMDKDAIILDCEYENEQHFDRNCPILKEKGFRFYTCPGTSNWKSYTGRSYNAVLNIIDAVECAKYYHAEGSMLTEWGNGGNAQFPAITYFTLVLFGALSWHVDKELKKTEIIKASKEYLDKFLFHTKKGSLADLIYDMGNYFVFEERTRWDRTELFNCYLNKEKATEGQKKRFERAYKYMRMIKEDFKDVEADEISKREAEIDCDIVLVLLDIILEHDKQRINKELARIKEEFIALWSLNNHMYGIHIFCDFVDELMMLTSTI